MAVTTEKQAIVAQMKENLSRSKRCRIGWLQWLDSSTGNRSSP